MAAARPAGPGQEPKLRYAFWETQPVPQFGEAGDGPVSGMGEMRTRQKEEDTAKGGGRGTHHTTSARVSQTCAHAPPLSLPLSLSRP
jgi:hypothetical protein